jgi:hypothetical protein
VCESEGGSFTACLAAQVIDGSHPSDGIAFVKDDTHEIYRYGGKGQPLVWRLADYGVATVGFVCMVASAKKIPVLAVDLV